MKKLLLLIPLAIVATTHAQSPKVEATVQSRLGYDSNPVAVSGPAATVLGDDDTLTYGFGVTGTAAWTEKKGVPPKLSLGYAGDVYRFDRRSSENYSTHRLTLGSTLAVDNLKVTIDASTLYIAGSRDTLTSVATGNANGTALWRERRRQWQHRAKLQLRQDFSAFMVRATGTVLDYEYQTHVVSGRTCFADRRDLQAAFEGGWKQSAASLWTAGVRIGAQRQATVPLPNSAYEYSNNYYRLTTGWEGKPWANTTVALVAGPSFHHYDGAIDSRVFLGGRDRTSLWSEASLNSKLTSTVSLTGKFSRWAWLSSTGKSAYLDTAIEGALNWSVAPAWMLRLNGKAQRSDYYPAYRDDWQSFLGVGASWKINPRYTLALDFSKHTGWNGLDDVAERSFHRHLVTLAVSAQF